MVWNLDFLTFLAFFSTGFCGFEEKEGVKYASKCETCKILSKEMEISFSKTGKSTGVLILGYSLDDIKPRTRKKYSESELRFIDSLEGVCDRVLDYKIHKERRDSTRFAKGMSQTFQTLHGLVKRGVKVDLGMPYELWDKPSAEIAHLKKQCEDMLEEYEDVIERWYFNEREKVPLIDYLCAERVLKNEDASCLYEEITDEDVKKEL